MAVNLLLYCAECGNSFLLHHTVLKITRQLKKTSRFFREINRRLLLHLYYSSHFIQFEYKTYYSMKYKDTDLA